MDFHVIRTGHKKRDIYFCLQKKISLRKKKEKTTDKCVLSKCMELFLPKSGGVTFPYLLVTLCRSYLTRSVLQAKVSRYSLENSSFLSKMTPITLEKSFIVKIASYLFCNSLVASCKNDSLLVTHET